MFIVAFELNEFSGTFVPPSQPYSTAMGLVDVSIQLSLGRIPVAIEDSDSVRDVKKKLRLNCDSVSHVPIGKFRFNVNGTYLSDESKPIKDYGVVSGSTLHLVKKSACQEAKISTERPVDE